MKSAKVLSVTVLLASLLFFSNCGPDPAPAPPLEDVQFDKLAKTWRVTNVTLDGQNRLSEYTGFQLVISGTKGSTTFNYSASSRPPLSPWPASGNWRFGTNVESQIIRQDATTPATEVPISYLVSDNQLQLTFQYSGNGFTRNEVVSGLWVFTFGLQ